MSWQPNYAVHLKNGEARYNGKLFKPNGTMVKPERRPAVALYLNEVLI